MYKNLRASSLILISGIIGLASIQNQAQAWTTQVKGNINAQGEIRDEAGQLLGQVMMKNSNTAFDLQNMNVRSDGTVVDANGATVGHLVLQKNWYSKAKESPAKAQQYSAQNQNYGQTQSTPQATPAQQQAQASAQNVQNEKAVLAPHEQAQEQAAKASDNSQPVAQAGNANSASEFEQRRIKLENSIQAGVSQGMISESQANHFRRYLVQSDTQLSEHKLNKIYKKWDRIALKLDEMRSHSAKKPDAQAQ